MLYGGGVLALVEVVLLVYCVLNIVTTPEGEVRNLPKLLWLLLVVVLPLVGGIAWLIAGRPQGPPRSLPYRGNRGAPAEPYRPGRAAALRPDDDEAFLRGLRERAEQQRREAQRHSREAQRDSREAQRDSREAQRHSREGERRPEEQGDDPVTPG